MSDKELTERLRAARERHSTAQAAHAEAKTAWDDAMRELTAMRSRHAASVELLTQQDTVAACSRRADALVMPLRTAEAQLRAVNGEALQLLRKNYAAAYLRAVAEVRLRLVDMVCIGECIGVTDCLTMHRTLLPAFDGVPDRAPGSVLTNDDITDSGAMSAGRTRLEMRLAQLAGELAPNPVPDELADGIGIR